MVEMEVVPSPAGELEIVRTGLIRETQVQTLAERDQPGILVDVWLEGQLLTQGPS